jgi:AraC-like DNA-binding protein
MTYYECEVERIRRECMPCAAVVERCRRARRLIDEGCCAGVDLDALARRLFVSKFHFIRQFSRCYGRTPYRYLTERRMQEAKALFDGGMSVAEVCRRVGFCSVPSFSQVFRRMTGWTPGAYREMRGSEMRRRDMAGCEMGAGGMLAGSEWEREGSWRGSEMRNFG